MMINSAKWQTLGNLGLLGKVEKKEEGGPAEIKKTSKCRAQAGTAVAECKDTAAKTAIDVCE